MSLGIPNDKMVKERCYPLYSEADTEARIENNGTVTNLTAHKNRP